MKPNQTEGSTGVEELQVENARLRQAYDYILASRNNVDRELNEANKQNAACLAALKELIPIAEAGQAYYRQNPGFDWVKEREKSKSAIERAKAITSK